VFLKTFKEPRNRFQGIDSASLCSLAGQYDKPIPTRFLALIDVLKFKNRRTKTPTKMVVVTFKNGDSVRKREGGIGGWNLRVRIES
jgi:hypothetical protein